MIPLNAQCANHADRIAVAELAWVVPGAGLRKMKVCLECGDQWHMAYGAQYGDTLRIRELNKDDLH